MLEYLAIQSPKRDGSAQIGRAGWYPYYPGFSPAFASLLLESSRLPKDSCILDPWNGSGTTTAAAVTCGHRAWGYDLNPVMVITAKARMLNKREKPNLWPITKDLLKKAVPAELEDLSDCDPLCTWFVPNSAVNVRHIERAIQLLLVEKEESQFLAARKSLDSLSDIAAFFYTALFRTIRLLVAPFFASNPTWVKKPKNKRFRLRPSLSTILDAFRLQVCTMIDGVDDDLFTCSKLQNGLVIDVASSESLPLPNMSVDFVLSSPPYCTRIDYAVASLPELTLLGYDPNGNFHDLRRRLIGTSTVPSQVPEPLAAWGPTCNEFLQQLVSHESKASQSYYYKNHLQYFDAIYHSLSEISRTLAFQGICVLVVQDSYYKNVHNDLPQIFVEMAGNKGLRLQRREGFSLSRTMAGINPGARRYRQEFGATESVLCFTKR